jgi:hypothetical protein
LWRAKLATIANQYITVDPDLVLFFLIFDPGQSVDFAIILPALGKWMQFLLVRYLFVHKSRVLPFLHTEIFAIFKHSYAFILIEHFFKIHTFPPFSPPAGRKNRFFSCAFAAKPQMHTKKIVTSLLPQAEKPLRLEQMCRLCKVYQAGRCGAGIARATPA